MQAIALQTFALIGSLMRFHALRMPVPQLLLVLAALLVAPAVVGPLLAVAVGGLRLMYVVVWVWWRYFAPAVSIQPSG
uniref:hypothetical protein n=1 Tax=Nonomuraea sp. CA-251285 TaxID=3240002 RepID=UPI003F49557F